MSARAPAPQTRHNDVCEPRPGRPKSVWLLIARTGVRGNVVLVCDYWVVVSVECFVELSSVTTYAVKAVLES